MVEDYTDKVMEHFMNPKNVGEMEDADGTAKVGNPTCGDVMAMYLKIDDEVITDAKFKTFGCGAAIASSSVTTEMIKGMTLEEAEQLQRKDVLEALGGLPEVKIHCSVLATDALHKAIENYRTKKEEQVK